MLDCLVRPDAYAEGVLNRKIWRHRPALFRATAFALVLHMAIITVWLSGRAHAGVAAESNDAPVIVVTELREQHLAPRLPARKIEPTYKIQVGLSNEIFPVFANHASLQKRDERSWGTVGVTITNSTDSLLRNRVTVQVPGWSDQEIQIAEMGAGDVRTLLFAPTFLPRLFDNREITAATVVVNVADSSGRPLFAQTVPIRLRASDDMYWGDGFKYAPFIASWVTPHDPRVEMVLSRAKEYAPNRRLPGYEDWKDGEGQAKATVIQMKAIYRAVQAEGLSYVKSSLTFGENTNISERIRMPRESLRQASANCIDGVVMYASLFENLGMEPAIVLVPGHAYIGVRLDRASNRYMYFDSALTGRATFEMASASAERGMAATPKSKQSVIHIAEARRAGIFPMPEAAPSDGDSASPVRSAAISRRGARDAASGMQR